MSATEANSSVFVFFREIPCHSVAMFLLGLPSVANTSALLPIRR
jgi:hypothetical protein